MSGQRSLPRFRLRRPARTDQPSLTLSDLTPQPRTRCLVVGSTGSGKSTLACSLLEEYHRTYPSHGIILVDPKRRYVALDPDEEDQDESLLPVFPEGFGARNHGRREGVAVFGDYLTRPKWPELGVGIVQDDESIEAVMSWLHAKSDVRRPVVLYLDESFDMVRGYKAIPSLRRLLQQGREIGVGVWVVNQRPINIDSTFISESQRLYVGRLNRPEDRERIADNVNDEGAARAFIRPLPKYTFRMTDQEHEWTSPEFRLTGV